jgi:hypothetical protein
MPELTEQEMRQLHLRYQQRLQQAATQQGVTPQEFKQQKPVLKLLQVHPLACSIMVQNQVIARQLPQHSPAVWQAIASTMKRNVLRMVLEASPLLLPDQDLMLP